jgi:tetratricopeptide (TPR) repeat protein
MRFCFVVLLICLAGTMSPADVAAELTRAMELERQGQVKEAERILWTIIRREEAADKGGLELAVALNHLGVLCAKTGRHADAERHLKRSIDILQALGGEAEQLRAKVALQLAELYLELDRAGDADRLNLPLLLETLRSPEDQAGVKAAIASVAIARRDLDTAERLYLEVLSFWMEPSRAAGSRREIATMLNNLGVVALRQGRMDLARERLERSNAAWQSLEPASPRAINSMANLAVLSTHQKRYDDAAMWLARSLAAARSAAGEFDPMTVAVHEAYAEALKKAGRKSEAREVARAAAEARRSMLSSSPAGYTVDYRDLMDLHRRGRR